MIIQRCGQYFTKLSVGDQVVGINAPGKNSSFKQSRFGSDVALQSLRHPDFDGMEQLDGKSKTCYAISGPGEYEISDIFVHGFVSRTKYDGVDEQINTVYSLMFDGINIVYLGPLQNTNVSEEIQEDLYMADIVFVPIGGGNVLEADEAFKFMKKISPRIVIPIGYDEKKDAKALAAFVSNFGDTPQAEEKLTIKKKDLIEEKMNVFLLKVI